MNQHPRIEKAVASINSALTARGFPPLDPEQVAVMQDRAAPAEAIGMLDELRDRVGGISQTEHRLAVEAVIANCQIGARECSAGCATGGACTGHREKPGE